jgi:hypothetical protein
VTLDELKHAVADRTVDTVLLAIADMEGRLQGKRLTASHFLGEVLEHGAEGCNYLLAVDVDMETVGVVLLAVGAWWLLSARHTFTGPIREIEIDETGRVVGERPLSEGLSE